MGALCLDDDVGCRWTRKISWTTEITITITSASSSIVSMSAALASGQRLADFAFSVSSQQPAHEKQDPLGSRWRWRSCRRHAHVTVWFGGCSTPMSRCWLSLDPQKVLANRDDAHERQQQHRQDVVGAGIWRTARRLRDLNHILKTCA
jgi:hypothetical protein